MHMLLNLPLDVVVPSDANPRLTLDRDAQRELKESIDKNGLLQPIAIRPVGEKYDIIGGHRRYLAFKELAREHPEDARFKTIPAYVIDAADNRVAAMRLAENINRADLSPIEIAEGIADALESGMTEGELADSLGWEKRNVQRFRQFHAAPAWLKAFAMSVPLASKKLDENGAIILHPVTDAPDHDIKELPGLGFTHLFELLTFYNQLREADQSELKERGGDKFRATAERTIKKLARETAKEDWSIATLRAEIARARSASPPTKTTKKSKAAVVITDERIVIERSIPLPRVDRDALAAELTTALTALGFKTVVISDRTY